jgi:signal transduction histidine kinase
VHTRILFKRRTARNSSEKKVATAVLLVILILSGPAHSLVSAAQDGATPIAAGPVVQTDEQGEYPLTPPLWQTRWFRGGLLLLLLGLVAGGFLLQQASARRRERQLEAQVAERTRELGERLKELDCLYGISSLASQADITLDDVLQGMVALLPQAWQYPEIACTRLQVDAREYVSEGWQDSDWRQSADIMVRGKRAGEVEVRYLESRPDADEGPFTTEERLLLNAVAERLGRITERIQAERTLRRRHSELSTILTVSREIARTLDLDALLELILTEAEKVITYDGAGIFTLSEKTLDFRYYRGIDLEADLLSLSIPIMAVTPFRELVLNGKPFIYDDLHDDPDLAAILSEATGFSLKALFGDCHSWLSVPLIAGGRVTGLLAFIHLQPGHYEVENQELAQVFANQAAIALENARLYRQSQKAAVLEERTRLAGELHDSVTQALYTSSLIAETLPDVWQRHPEEALRTLGDLRDLTQGALAEMRALLLELRPGALTNSKLSELLHQLTTAMSARTDLPITTTVSGERSLPEDVKIALYRIAQEALNNVSKHARANQAWVSLHGAANEATLRIRDNGRGFDPEAVSPHQMGLSIMRGRAEVVGATLSVQSQPGQGTEVVVTWSGDGALEDSGQSWDDDRRHTDDNGPRADGGADE